jgi:hypothetical protein
VKILLGCDVDPVLPPLLEQPPAGDIWGCLANVDELVRVANDTLPPITWLIRSDDSIRFCTGDFASGYRSKQTLWRSLEARGHEVGWHVHTWSFDEHRGCFLFEPVPSWLAAAHAALADCFSVRATRTGWDYGSSALFERLDHLGVVVDFSALPGYVVWHRVGSEDVKVDWLRCPATPYHPASDDYQRPGALRLLEVPVTQFANSIPGAVMRLGWRIRHGCWVLAGLGNKTRMLTEQWDEAPVAQGPVMAFHFHPEDLTGAGLANLMRNVAMLRRLPDTEFVTASAAHAHLTAAQVRA